MAKKTKSSKNGMSTQAKVAIGVGLTTAAVAAVGGYFLYGSKNAKQNRKKAKSWMLKAKAHVLEGIENVKDITQEEYEELVEKAVKVYGRAKNVSAAETTQFVREMKGHWKDIQNTGKKKTVAKKGRKTAKKSSTKKKSTRKTSTKTARKRK